MNLKKIAIVDDESELAETMCQFLKDSGFESRFFTSAELLIESLKIDEYALVISDLKMSGQSGIELFESIHSLDLPSRPRFVLMSGLIDTSKFKDYYAQGIDEIVSKPFDLHDLITVINMVLESGSEDVSKEMEFFPIGISEFINSSSNNYDVFLKIDTKFVCIAKKGQPLTVKRIEQLQQKGVKKVFLIQADFLKYSDVQLRLTDTSTLSKLDLNKRKKLIGHLIDVVAQSSLLKNNQNAILEKAVSNFEGVSFAVSLENTVFECLKKIMYSSSAHAERTSLQSVLTSATAHSWGWNNPKLQAKIIMAGLFCDIGMRELPHLLTKKRFDYEANDVVDFESHPDRSAKILESIPGIPPEVIIIARQHHENDIGRGFPYKMKKDQLHPIGRMVHVVSDFLDLVLLNPNNLDLEKNLEQLVNQKIVYSEQVLKALYLIFNVPVHAKLEKVQLPDKTMILT